MCSVLPQAKPTKNMNEDNSNFSQQEEPYCSRTPSASSDQSRMVTDHRCDIYLSRLITFQTALGSTYFGNCFNPSRVGVVRSKLMNRLFMIGILVYDSVCVAAIMYLEYNAFSDYVYHRLFTHSSKKLTMNIIFRLSGYCMFVEYILVKLMTIFRGSRILAIIYQIGDGVNIGRQSIRSYYRIYLTISIVSVLHSAAFTLMFSWQLVDNMTLFYTILYCTFYAVAGILYGVNKTSVCSLHHFTAIVITKRIEDVRANLVKCSNFGYLLTNMLELKKLLTELNELFSVVLLAKTLINGILLSSCVCAIEDKLHDEVLDLNSLIALFCLFICQLIDEIVSCYSSQTIANTMKRLTVAIQDLVARQSIELLENVSSTIPMEIAKRNIVTNVTFSPIDNNNTSIVPMHYSNHHNINRKKRLINELEFRCLQYICSMETSFCFNVMNMFDLRSLTVLVILSNVFNYAVILIQTQ